MKRFRAAYPGIVGSILTLTIASTWFGAAPALAYLGDLDGDGIADGREVMEASNPNNVNSTPESLSFDALTGGTTCSDAIDNDGDGSTDGADPGCINSDGDSINGIPMDDQIEYTLGSDAGNPASVPEHWLIDTPAGIPLADVCSDAVDNDLDGWTDLAGDYKCASDFDLDGLPNAYENAYDSEVSCWSGLMNLVGSCVDGVDNDDDGLTDSADPGCNDADGDGISDLCDSEGSQPNNNGLGGVNDCYDGIDNDGDGATDLEEPACHVCFDSVATIEGDAADNILSGTPAADVIMGHGGNDRISGADGADKICAGPGADRISGGLGADRIDGGEGDDRIVGGAGNDIVHGGLGNDKLVGSAEDDVLHGEGGDDKLIGGAGFDALYGGPGNDHLAGGADDDYLDDTGGGENVLIGGAGDDYLYGYYAIANVMRGGGGNDLMFGGDGPDNMNGGGGNDQMYGYGGNDVMRGAGGDDFLDGGDGDDALNGGGGTDTCQGGLGTDTANASCETINGVP